MHRAWTRSDRSFLVEQSVTPLASASPNNRNPTQARQKLAAFQRMERAAAAVSTAAADEAAAEAEWNRAETKYEQAEAELAAARHELARLKLESSTRLKELRDELATRQASKALPTVINRPALDDVNLCAAFAANDINKVLFIGDSTVANLFAKTIYSTLPPTRDPRETVKGQPALSKTKKGQQALKDDTKAGEFALAHYCKGRLFHGTDKGLYQERGLETSACAYARRCEGKVELLTWRGGGEGKDQNKLLRDSLNSKAKSWRKPDAVVYSLGTHFMAEQSNEARFSEVLQEMTEILLEMSSIKAIAFFTMLGSDPSRKMAVHRQMQSNCEIGKLNAHAFAITSAYGVPTLDSLAFSQRLWGRPLNQILAHSTDGTHWDGMTVANQSQTVVQALLSNVSTHRNPVRFEDARAALSQCKFGDMKVAIDGTTSGELTKKLRTICERSTAKLGMPACLFSAQSLSNRTVEVRYSCVGCNSQCGAFGGDCGSNATVTAVVPKGLRHVSFYCPAWGGEEMGCGSLTPDVAEG